MVIKTERYALPDTYLELVRQFPLIHIRDDAHLTDAQEMLDWLLTQELDEGGQAYLDALTDHVEVYEAAHVHIPDASDVDVLRELMSANRLSQPKLAKATGIAQSTISAVLSGTRKLTRAHVAKLAAFFNVPASVFLPS